MQLAGVELVVAPAPHFAISRSDIYLTPGTSTDSSLTTTISGGFNAPITLSVSGLPPGVTVSLNPSTIAAPGAGNSTLTVTAESWVASGDRATITMTGVGAGKTRTADFGLSLMPAPNAGLRIVAWPNSLSAAPGDSVNCTVATTASSGFNSPVFLTVGDGLFVGQSGKFLCLYSDDLSLVVSANSALVDPFIDWVITRVDTGATLVSRTTRYSDPGGSSLLFLRTTQDLQMVEEFNIIVRIYVPGQILSYTLDVPVLDWVSRRKPYVKWVSQTWFRDPNKPRQWRYYWERTRNSVIHRTDFPGRCRRLSPPWEVLSVWLNGQPPNHIARFKYLAQWIDEDWTYLDSLPFANEEQATARRHGVLCDYCFFGGPTKSKLLVSIP
jgi:hypothetical protein